MKFNTIIRYKTAPIRSSRSLELYQSISDFSNINMADLSTPRDQVVAVSGQFRKFTHRHLKSFLPQYGAKFCADNTCTSDYTAIIAADNGLNTKATQAAREAKKPILKESWWQKCYDNKRWVTPVDDDYDYKGEVKQGEKNGDEQGMAKGDKQAKGKADEQGKTGKQGENGDSNGNGDDGDEDMDREDNEEMDLEVMEQQLQKLSDWPELESLWKKLKDLKRATKEDHPQAIPSQVSSNFQTWVDRSGDNNLIKLRCHPEDVNKPEGEQRRGYEMRILFQTAWRSLLFLVDLETKAKATKSLAAGYLVRKADYPLEAKAFIETGGLIISASGQDEIKDESMTDFIWWSVATIGKVCYSVGVVNGEEKPRLFARTTLKAEWGKDVDQKIDEIFNEFGQPLLSARAGSKGSKKLN
jgi:hypothetical protein